MAGRPGAVRLVVDRGDEPEHAPALRAVDTGPLRKVEAFHRPSPAVALRARLGVGRYERAGLVPVGREGDPSLLVEHADAVDRLEAADLVHDAVGLFFVRAEHLVVGAPHDASAEESRPLDRLVLEVALLHAEPEHGEGAEREDDARGREEDEAGPEATRPGERRVHGMGIRGR
jgi:hypothetical protein